ncbi:MAG: DNA adenine methylase, partial [Armatimonadetes bacterium]|nr:DNA adenine methylase [Armatimonadota bacterium]
DAFGGTGVVSFLLKKMGKRVVYNDYLLSNYWCGVALIENSSVHLTKRDLAFLLGRRGSSAYPTFIADTFREIYYTDEENAWLDQTAKNIRDLDELYGGTTLRHKTALAYHALVQSALMKRPFNLFHRRNLYIRTADVKRSFGNKTTWETPFTTLFRRLADESSRVVFGNGRQNRAMNLDALDAPTGFDLVYIDTPYLSAKASHVNSDYHALYHFLDGLCQYEAWPELIDDESLHKRLVARSNGWNDKTGILGLFEELIKRHSRSKLVISYRTPGIPTREELETLLAKYGKCSKTYERRYTYALNKRNGHPGENIEILIVAT